MSEEATAMETEDTMDIGISVARYRMKSIVVSRQPHLLIALLSLLPLLRGVDAIHCYQCGMQTGNEAGDCADFLNSKVTMTEHRFAVKCQDDHVCAKTVNVLNAINEVLNPSGREVKNETTMGSRKRDRNKSPAVLLPITWNREMFSFELELLEQRSPPLMFSNFELQEIRPPHGADDDDIIVAHSALLSEKFGSVLSPVPTKEI
ncbi:unnamed protein product [Cyprideis torosa]|uniref:Uncharacterized protein n=1 Tax=Cyprideis torosa TaxID=163714 RepID=A0A7R8W5M8_9CRUS|nr:unnamed protein product [Cyprideis torosa]CAG0884481.1 unnamed protein product [Cyprideis torosa]